jgi:hypothetical protein
MALFTDGPISSAEDLQEYDSSVLTVANAESIDVAVKITLAQQDLGNELMLFLFRRASFRVYQPNVARRTGLPDVVVTQAMQQWHVMTTLALVYRDAYYSQLNDRYQGKWNEYEQLAKASLRTYFQLGVGVVADPIPMAPAPELSSVAGTGVAEMLYVAATWVNGVGQEGAPSDVATLKTGAGAVLVATLIGPPQNAAGWNVYVGLSPTALTRQNDSPLALGSSWIMTGPLSPGVAPSTGQPPAWFIVDHRFVNRG